jgi:hypothetical protein
MQLHLPLQRNKEKSFFIIPSGFANVQIIFCLFFDFNCFWIEVYSQSISAKKRIYGIVIKGGHVIDPKNNINEVMDIATEIAPPSQKGQPVTGT